MSNIFVNKVEVIDNRMNAWIMSRPYIKNAGEVDWKNIDSMDMSVNDLKYMVFHFRSSAAFRELLTSFRPYVMFAQTSRVNPLEYTEYSSYVDDVLDPETCQLIDDQITQIKQIASSGEPFNQDVLRMKLPLANITEYYYGANMRTWIVILKTIKKYYPELYNIYCSKIEQYLNQDLDEYPQKAMNMTYCQDMSCGSMSSDNFCITPVKMTIAQRAQLARHGGISLVDSLWDYNINGLYSLSLSDHIYGELSCRKDIFERMVSHRICWIAHYEEWLGLTSAIVKDKFEFAKRLPCNCNAKNCPFKEDNKGRVEGKEKGIPCPIFTDNHEYVDQRRSEQGACLITNYYGQIVR